MNSSATDNIAAQRRKYHRDSRIVAARKHYREHIKSGMPEKTAWELFLQVQQHVIKEINDNAWSTGAGNL